jgi:hypothetical protein
VNRIGRSRPDRPQCADAAKRCRFDGVDIVLAAVFGPPSAGRKGRQKSGQASKRRHRECAQSLDGMQLPHSLPGLIIVSIVMRNRLPLFGCAISPP